MVRALIDRVDGFSSNLLLLDVRGTTTEGTVVVVGIVVVVLMVVDVVSSFGVNCLAPGNLASKLAGLADAEDFLCCDCCWACCQPIMISSEFMIDSVGGDNDCSIVLEF